MASAPWRPPLQDEDSWRLPDWEAYSESGRSAWTDDGDSDASSASAAALRVPRVARSTTTLTRVDDLRALHARFAQERRRAAAVDDETKEKPADQANLLDAQTQIAAQLARVREELRAFQHEWQRTAATTAAAAAAAPQEDRREGETRDMASVALAVAPYVRSGGERRDGGGTLRFDMAVQTDVAAVHDDALRQWLYLITQKMEVLTTSFHGDTTQLPLKYPLQTQLDRPVSFASVSGSDEEFSVASWHVGGQLKTLVGEETAERLLDLERAVACLATATRHTTSRYVEYFEKIVVQIQDLHQQRLRQVVDESLQEMKAQRSKYKKRVEQLEAECQAAKHQVITWQQKAMAATNLNTTDTEKLQAVLSAREQQWEREREQFVSSIERLQQQVAGRDLSQTDGDTRLNELRTQLTQMTALLEVAQRQSDESAADVRAKDEQMRQLKQQHRIEMERFEHIHTQLRDEILQFQKDAERSQQEIARRHAHELETAATAAAAAREREHARLTQEHDMHIEEIEQRWRTKLEDAEETKMLVPAATLVDQQVQTNDEFIDEGTTDERIARLKKRCKALESLLDKKFEDSSAASVVSMDSAVSGRWSSRSESRMDSAYQDASGDVGSRTLPLTMSFGSSLDGTYASTHPANTPSRDDMKNPPIDTWETALNRSGRSMERPTSGATVRATVPDPDTPSPQAMLALVRKLEALATTKQLPGSKSATQPDEEPDLSAATTPTRKPAVASRPTSVSFQKPGSASNRSFGVAGSYSAAVHSLKDPRRRQQQAGRSKPGKSAVSTSAASSVAKSRHQERTQTRFGSR